MNPTKASNTGKKEAEESHAYTPVAPSRMPSSMPALAGLVSIFRASVFTLGFSPPITLSTEMKREKAKTVCPISAMANTFVPAFP